MSREIIYNMQKGMVEYFMVELKLPKGEVWGAIKDACHKSVDKLDNNNKSKSWCYADVPNSDIKLRIDVKRRTRYYSREVEEYISKESYYADVKFSNVSDYEQITDEQVEEYIIEKILLGDDDCPEGWF
jgi:hypothetical protein